LRSGLGQAEAGHYALPPSLALRLERAAPRVGPFARAEWHPEVGSTNDVALRRGDTGAPEGLVVLADMQTAGRGRLGRRWISPPGSGVYVSVLLRPPALTPLFTLAAGVASAEAIEVATGLRPTVKWPNDICVLPSQGPPRKLGGVLAEGRAAAGDGACVLVIGIGINVRSAAYPPDVAGLAASLEDELGRPVERDLVIVELLAALWRHYDDIRRGRTADVLTAWRECATATFGRRIEWQDGAASGTGVIEDVDESGALLVRTDRGVVRIVSGEVRWMS
jgi:BirA family transcriptional regulator, biotin operon repressor / biotin---[acetyl-CoA-carboxylase] ligase